MRRSPIRQLAALSAPEPVGDDVLRDELAELEQVSLALSEHTQAASTRRAYAKAWRSFSPYCDEHR